MSEYFCVCMCSFTSKNDDRITTHSELCSGNRGPRQRMREQRNIFIRQEQVPPAKNEFVRLLDRPCCTDSTQAELDSTTSEQEKKGKVSSLFQAQPCVCTWDRDHKGTDNQRTDVKLWKGYGLNSNLILKKTKFYVKYILLKISCFLHQVCCIAYNILRTWQRLVNNTHLGWLSTTLNVSNTSASC